jgi:hypothetical protein
MEYRKPPCGSTSAHPAHLIPRLGGDIDCGGWTEAEADTCVLIDRLMQLRVDRAYGKVPDSVILECHPSVPYAIQGIWIPGYAEFVNQDDEPWHLSTPVLIEPAMKPGEWRLVIADGMVREQVSHPAGTETPRRRSAPTGA